MYCSKCGSKIDDEAAICPSCGVPTENYRQEKVETSKSQGLIISGYICAILSLFIFPPAFGLAGAVIGIMNLTKGIAGHGICQLILSIVCAIIGMIIGAALMAG
jgi:uncharacterized OB-fold protein